VIHEISQKQMKVYLVRIFTFLKGVLFALPTRRGKPVQNTGTRRPRSGPGDRLPLCRKCVCISP